MFNLVLFTALTVGTTETIDPPVLYETPRLERVDGEPGRNLLRGAGRLTGRLIHARPLKNRPRLIGRAIVNRPRLVGRTVVRVFGIRK